MAVKISSVLNDQQFNSNGLLLSGGKIETYLAGSSTPATTFTSESGTVTQFNPIILNTRGEVPNLIYLTTGVKYKFLLKDSANNLLRTYDNIEGVNDSASSIDQWINTSVSPTYLNATQFTLAGDQTSNFHVNRRVKILLASGTLYGYISASVFATLTTITVVLDSGALDAGLSSVQLGLVTSINSSIRVGVAQIADASITTAKIVDASITYAKIDNNLQKNSPIQSVLASVAANALTATFNGGNLDFRNATLSTGTTNSLTVASNSIVVPSAATLGTVNAIAARLVLLEAYNAGTPVLCIVNLAGGLQLDETNLISPTIISAGATSASVIYSASAVSASSPYRIVGFIDITEATAGTWATPPAIVQGSGSQVKLVSTNIVRLNTANGYGSTNNKIRRFSTIVTNQGLDITYADSATNGASFTINTNGIYAISYSDCFNANTVAGITLNSIQLTTGISSVVASDILSVSFVGSGANSIGSSSATLFLPAGSIVRPHTDGAATGTSTGTTQFIITRVS